MRSSSFNCHLCLAPDRPVKEQQGQPTAGRLEAPPLTVVFCLASSDRPGKEQQGQPAAGRLEAPVLTAVFV